jgi:hypothetical protein
MPMYNKLLKECFTTLCIMLCTHIDKALRSSFGAKITSVMDSWKFQILTRLAWYL